MAAEKKFTLSLIIETILNKLGLEQAKKELEALRTETKKTSVEFQGFSSFAGDETPKKLRILGQEYNRNFQGLRQLGSHVSLVAGTLAGSFAAGLKISTAAGESSATTMEALNTVWTGFAKTLNFVIGGPFKALGSLIGGNTKSWEEYGFKVKESGAKTITLLQATRDLKARGWDASLESAKKHRDILQGIAEASYKAAAATQSLLEKKTRETAHLEQIGLRTKGDLLANLSNEYENLKKLASIGEVSQEIKTRTLELEVAIANIQRESIRQWNSSGLQAAQNQIDKHGETESRLRALYAEKIKQATFDKASSAEIAALALQRDEALSQLRMTNQAWLEDETAATSDFFTAFLGGETRLQQKIDEREQSEREAFAARVQRWIEENEQIGRILDANTGSEDEKVKARIAANAALRATGEAGFRDSLAFIDSELEHFRGSEELKRQLLLDRAALQKNIEAELTERLGQAGQIIAQIAAFEQQESQEKLARLEREKQREIELAGENKAAVSAIELKYAKKAEQEKKKAFAAHKAFAIVDIAINTAQAIAKAAAAYDWVSVAAFAILGALQTHIVMQQKYQGQARHGADRTREGGMYVHDDEAVLPAAPAEKMRAVGALLETMSPRRFVDAAALASVGAETRAVGSAGIAAGAGGGPVSNSNTSNVENRTVYEFNGDVIAMDSRDFERRVTRSTDGFRRNVENRNTRS